MNSWTNVLDALPEPGVDVLWNGNESKHNYMVGRLSALHDQFIERANDRNAFPLDWFARWAPLPV